MSNPKPTLYNYTKAVFIVVQCDRNYAIWMCTCPVDESLYNLALTHTDERICVFKWLTMMIYLLIHKQLSVYEQTVVATYNNKVSTKR